MFEARPDTTEAVRMLMDTACDWLRQHGLEAARTGMGPSFDLPYIIDEYDLLPPVSTRQNPAYYHSLLKEARFETEKGWVDYKIEVTPALVERWEHMVAGAEQAGFRVLAMSDVPADRRVPDFTATWEDAFAHHWGISPLTEAEWQELFEFAGPLGMYDISVIAYRGEDPVGVILGMPDLTVMASVADGRELSGAERLNMLGIGVHESARGRGVNLAIAAKSYLELVKRGSTHVSYTLVLDDNWPSRRTAEKLGAYVCANYLVYRREFAKPGAG
jgi:GNAT superfamily N-acetyltransferase